jgi:hypothetical protein
MKSAACYWTGFSRSAVATNLSWWSAGDLIFDSHREPGFEPALIFHELGLWSFASPAEAGWSESGRRSTSTD